MGEDAHTVTPRPALVSVLLPSRGRPGSLIEAGYSLLETASDPYDVEIIVGYDADDPATLNAAKAFKSDTLLFPTRHGYDQLHLYMNELAKWASGRWLLLWNDDATMTTHSWDSIIGQFDHTTPLVLSPSSTGYGHGLCCFPAASRALYDTLGHLSFSPHVDTWLQDLGRATGTIRDIPVHVPHDRADLTGGHQDQTRAESLAGYRTDAFYGDEMQALLHADIERIRSWPESGG